MICLSIHIWFLFKILKQHAESFNGNDPPRYKALTILYRFLPPNCLLSSFHNIKLILLSMPVYQLKLESGKLPFINPEVILPVI